MSAIAAIHAGLRQLGIAEEDARDIYERQTGRRSLREMQPRQLEAVVGELRRLGFKPASTGARKRLEGRFAPKLQALWIAGYNLGLIRDRTDQALIAFVRRQTSLDHVRFLHHADDANRAIQALKGWLAREGGVDWTRDQKAPAWSQTNGARIVAAQLRKLENGAPDLAAWFAANAGRLPTLPATVAHFGPPDWVRLMNHLGERVRSPK